MFFNSKTIAVRSTYQGMMDNVRDLAAIVSHEAGHHFTKCGHDECPYKSHSIFSRDARNVNMQRDESEMMLNVTVPVLV